MKTTIKTIASVFAFALLSTGAFAADKAKTDTTTNNVTASVTYYENVFGVDVNIDKATEGEAMVTIYDTDGDVLLSDKFENENATVKKSYLLNDLAEGDYTIEVATGTGVVKKVVSLSSDDSTEKAFAF